MVKSDYELGTFVVPKEGYKVSEKTAAIVDCIRLFDAFYSRVYNTLGMIHGEEYGEIRMDEKYCPLWGALDDLLHQDLQASIMENLISTSNSYNKDEILL